MKTSAVILTLCLVALVKANEDSDYQKAAKYLESCYEDIGIVQGITELTESQEKCGVACLFKALKLMNEDGSLNYDNILAASTSLNAEKLDEIVNTCQRAIGEVELKEYYCEIASCIQKNKSFLE